MKRKRILTSLLIIATFLLVVAIGMGTANALTLEEQLGESIFFDEDLSINGNQSCASCHGPEVGFTGPQSDTNALGAVYEGSISGEFGNRKPPSAAYATVSPIFHLDKKGLWTGGNFWDGRATGEILGNPAADQALLPFLNPVEQALPDADELVTRVCASTYSDLFKQVWGEEACDPANVLMAYGNIGLSIAAYEDSSEVNAFTSKFDICKLTREERRGLSLFKGKGKCRLCHIINGKNPLLTDFTYDNLGVPKNPWNPVYNVDPDFIDEGLGGFLKNEGAPPAVYEPEMGKVKVPTLRNVAKGSCETELDNPDCIVKAYGHNGYFKSLEGIVHFYNTRDVKPTCPDDYTEDQALDENCWPAPEVLDTMNTSELGDLGLTPEEEAAIVSFLKTLSDGYMP